MAEQLEHLIAMARLPAVTVRVLPFSVGMLRAHAGRFVLLEIPRSSGSDVVFVEGHAGDSYLDAESDVELYKDVLADAQDRALTPDASLELIGRYLVKHAPPEKGRSRR